MLEKYWLKKTNDINDLDTNHLVQLRMDMKNRNYESPSIAENLKSTSMLLNLDWIQDHPNLYRDFEQYLNILKENNFKQMMLLGGTNVIDITVRWERFSEADKLIQSWLEKSAKSFNSEEILSFSNIQLSQKNYWVTINLLGNYLESNKDLGAESFDILAMRYMAILDLNKIIEDPSNIKQDSLRSQVKWVLNSKSKEDLIELANKCLADAKKSFSELKEPNKVQLSIKKKLDQITLKADKNN